MRFVGSHFDPRVRQRGNPSQAYLYVNRLDLFLANRPAQHLAMPRHPFTD